MSYFRQHGYLK